MDPEEIENRQFLVSLRGYARDEVETFREEVAQEIKILRKQLTKANSELSHANTELARVKEQLAETSVQLAEQRSKQAPVPEPQSHEPAPAEDRASVFRLVGQETERILLAAEQAAEQIHDRAVAESAEIMADARMKVEQSLAEFEAARRAAEEDFAGIRDSRAMVASQLEDIRRRLEETIGRLRVPVELPGSKPVSRFRQSETAERGTGPAPADRRPADAQAQQRLQREMEAAKELQARQTAHRTEADRREEELKAVQAEAERRARADAERQAQERAAAAGAAAAKKAQQATELHAAVAAAQEAEILKNAREAERQKVSEDASAAVKARAGADEQAAAARQGAETAKAEAAAKAKAEADRQARERAEAEKSAKAKAEADRVAKELADAQIAARTAEAGDEQVGKETAPPKPGRDGGSSLDELLAEIRRKREEEGQAVPKKEAPAQAASEDKLADVPAPPAAKDDALVRRSEALGDLPAQTARRLKRLLQEDHNDLLDRLRVQRGKGPLDDNLAPQEEQAARFSAGLKEALGRAFAEGRKAGGAQSESDPSPAITKLVARQVVTPLRAEVSNAIAAGLQAEDSASALSERANDVFRVWKGVRTQLLGEGIAYSAYHQGLLDVWRTKASSTKQWVISDEEAECPNDICRRNADAGKVPTKNPFPSGHLAPPAHGGCTCTLKGS